MAVIVLVASACGGVGVVRVETRPPAVAATMTARSAPEPILAPEDRWKIEPAADAAVLPRIALTVGAQGTFIVYGAPDGRGIERVRRGTRRWWAPEHVVDGGSVRVELDQRSDGGPSWALIGDEPGTGQLSPVAPASIWALRLKIGERPESVLAGTARAYALAVTPGGTPNACASTSEHPGLAYAVRTKRGWSTSILGGESDRCAIAVGGERTIIVSAGFGGVEVLVRSGAGRWEGVALSPGDRFASVDVAIRGTDAVVAFSRGSQLNLARRQADGAWTQQALVVDAGGVVGALALALDSTGRAQVAYSVRRQRETSDEVALASEATGTSSTVVTDQGWRFTSLSLALDDRDSPHIAYTGAAGHVFYASLAR